MTSTSAFKHMPLNHLLYTNIKLVENHSLLSTCILRQGTMSYTVEQKYVFQNSNFWLAKYGNEHGGGKTDSIPLKQYHTTIVIATKPLAVQE